ncbi:hypothetical protein BY996DRAFT_4576453, partial [Phakopsora pachyrhizi]
VVQKDETNHTVDDPQNIANSVCSASQRATKSVGIATPTNYANLVATRAKKLDISDENGSTVFTTNSGTQTSGERHCEFDYFKNKINKMNEKVKLISHQMWGLKKNINKGGMVKKKNLQNSNNSSQGNLKRIGKKKKKMKEREIEICIYYKERIFYNNILFILINSLNS